MKMKLKSTLVVSIVAVLALLFAVSCGDGGEVRKYKEKAPVAVEKQEKTSPHGSMSVPKASGKMPGMGKAKAGAHFKWETPEGWQEDKTGSGFRLATFNVKSGEASATCTIIPLSGNAGGLKANVSRWLGQVTSKAGHMDPMLAEGDDSTVKKLLEKQEKFVTKAQFHGVFVDFTPVTAKDTDNSILVSMISVSGSTVFVKMTGPKSILVANRDKFRTLSKSFNMGNPPETKPAAPQK